MPEDNISSVSMSICCGWEYVVDVTRSLFLSVVDSLVPRIIPVEYLCHNAVVGNIVVDVTGSVFLSVDDS